MDVGRRQTSDTGGKMLSAERTEGHYHVGGVGSLKSDSRARGSTQIVGNRLLGDGSQGPPKGGEKG